MRSCLELKFPWKGSLVGCKLFFIFVLKIGRNIKKNTLYLKYKLPPPVSLVDRTGRGGSIWKEESPWTSRSGRTRSAGKKSLKGSLFWFFSKSTAPGLHKLWYPGIRDRSTWGKFGAHGEHGDVFLFSNLGALWFSENLIRYSLHVYLREVKNTIFSIRHSYLRHLLWRF